MTKTFTNQEMGLYIDIFMNLHETGKLGYAIARNQRRMTDASQEYLNMRNEAFKKYGTKVGQRYTIDEEKDPDNYKAYMDEMGEIPDITSDVDIFQVDEETFCSGHLTSNQMSALLWMVKDEKGES